MTVVRRARAEDAGGIACVWARAWQIASRDLVPGRSLDAICAEDRRSRWISQLQQVDGTFVVEDDGIAGYCRVAPPSQVASSYVLPERRRRTLLTAGLYELRSHRVQATLWVFRDYRAVRAFYARFASPPTAPRRWTRTPPSTRPGCGPGIGVGETRLEL